MKAGIHPDYRDVVFQDVTSEFKILTRSTLSSKETVKWDDGNEYPLIKIEVSSSSHPFYTGQNKIMDTSGRPRAAVCISGPGVPAPFPNLRLAGADGSSRRSSPL